MQASNYVSRVRSGISAATYGIDELLAAIRHDNILSTPESIRIAIEDYFEICDTILEQLKILYDISAENKEVKKAEIEENISILKNAYREGIDVSYQEISKILIIVESKIFSDKNVSKKQIEEEEGKKEKAIKLIPSQIKKNVQYKKVLTKDYFFIIKLLNTKEEEIKNISIKKFKEGQKDSKISATDNNTSEGYAERFANKH